MRICCLIPIFWISYPIKSIFFIETNATPEINHCTFWETLKVYLRGQLIFFASHERKKRFSILTNITNFIFR